jgi:hypothetical protein
LLTRKQPLVLVKPLALRMRVLLLVGPLWVGLLLVEPPVLGEPLVRLQRGEPVAVRAVATCRAACPD